jgi:hypothetical protein
LAFLKTTILPLFGFLLSSLNVSEIFLSVIRSVLGSSYDNACIIFLTSAKSAFPGDLSLIVLLHLP